MGIYARLYYQPMVGCATELLGWPMAIPRYCASKCAVHDFCASLRHRTAGGLWPQWVVQNAWKLPSGTTNGTSGGENGPRATIVDFPIKNGGIFHCYVSLNKQLDPENHKIVNGN